MTSLQRMGEWIAKTKDEALPPSVRQRLAIHLLDAVAAWVAGGATAEGKKLALLESSPSQPLPLFTRETLDCLALGVATTRLTEIDDIHMPSCTTPSSVVVPAALILAARLRPQDSRAFARSLFAGYEVITRVGEAISGPNILKRGIWPTYFAAPVCAAAVAASMAGLNASDTASALGIALATASGAPGGITGSSPRWLLLGMAARAGCASALAAAGGYAGDVSLLDTDWILRTHGFGCDAGRMAAPSQGDGAVSEVSLKPYCAAKQTIAAIEAFRLLLSRGISPNDIAAVRVAVPAAYVEMIGHRNAAAGRVARITSVAYHLALAAFRPAELENISRPNLAGEPEIAAFMSRVEVVADETLSSLYPQRWPALVEAELKNRARKANLVLDAVGDPPRFGELDVRAKFCRLVEPVIGVSAARELERLCLSATEQDEALATLCARFNS